MNKLELSIRSEVSEIVKVENFIESFLTVYKITPELSGEITLPVIEAVNNAVLSGNKMSANKLVYLEAWEDETRLYVSVKDEGEGFDYSDIPDPTIPDNIEKIAGRGLFLMKSLSDELIFEDNGSKVTLAFNLSKD